MSALDDLFAQTDEEPVPGGCDHCDAYQTVEVVGPNVYALHVHHDDWCPVLKAKGAPWN